MNTTSSQIWWRLIIPMGRWCRPCLRACCQLICPPMRIANKQILRLKLHSFERAIIRLCGHAEGSTTLQISPNETPSIHRATHYMWTERTEVLTPACIIFSAKEGHSASSYTASRWNSTTSITAFTTSKSICLCDRCTTPAASCAFLASVLLFMASSQCRLSKQQLGLHLDAPLVTVYLLEEQLAARVADVRSRYG